MGNRKQQKILRLDKKTIETILSELISYKRVKITGLGIFEVKRMRARKGYDPGAREYRIMPAYNKITFHPSRHIKRMFQSD